MTPTVGTTSLSSSPAATAVSTRRLLVSAAVGAPLWVAVSLAQAATRDGFDLTRHPLSMLSNGSLGWLQITNFVVTGVLTAVGAFGLGRALRGTPGGTWVPRLVLVNGIGNIAAGVFVMDPGDGFAGAPAGTPETLSGAAVGHLIAGSLALFALAAANFVLGRHFSRAGERGLAIGSRIAGAALLLGNGWASAGGGSGSLTLAIGAIIAMLWVSYVALLTFRGTAAAGHGRR
ncbi:DUF998 domain-containing protein [Streptomyces sp. NPDC004609]|uniref:DUF998 domain-containing protein n=1 Tax=Streptomyces sp. NPDC004609 TaxID=3364704 RepID=UPI0036BA0B1C